MSTSWALVILPSIIIPTQLQIQVRGSKKRSRRAHSILNQEGHHFFFLPSSAAWPICAAQRQRIIGVLSFLSLSLSLSLSYTHSRLYNILWVVDRLNLQGCNHAHVVRRTERERRNTGINFRTQEGQRRCLNLRHLLHYCNNDWRGGLNIVMCLRGAISYLDYFSNREILGRSKYFDFDYVSALRFFPVILRFSSHIIVLFNHLYWKNARWKKHILARCLSRTDFIFFLVK